MCEKRTPNMRRKIPSTNALIAFEAAARHESFTLAADELALTQSAVGRQIGGLEEFLGVKLFRRTRRGVKLTAYGVTYGQSVRARLDDVERDTLDLIGGGAQGGTLELAVVPTFATHWLVPRLSQLRMLHPELQVNLHVRTRPFLFAEERLDAAILATEGAWPGTRSELLFAESLVAVCAPSLMGSRKRLAASDIARLPLIQMTTRPYAWRKWFRSHGVATETDMAGARVELFSMAIQAAIHAQGAALVPELFVEQQVRLGQLREPLRSKAPSGLGYHLIYPDSGTLGKSLSLFRDWLSTQATREREAGASS